MSSTSRAEADAAEPLGPPVLVGGVWSLRHGAEGWILTTGADPAPRSRITVDEVTAARLLLHRLHRDGVEAQIRMEGDARLAAPFLDARAVMVHRRGPDPEA